MKIFTFFALTLQLNLMVNRFVFSFLTIKPKISSFTSTSQSSNIRLLATTKTTNFESIQSLLSEVIQILSSTGIRSGIFRTVQATRVVSKLLKEYLSKPSEFQNEKGQLFTPRVIKKLFEGLGATYIKLGQWVNLLKVLQS